jgi:hypothetical protein
MPVESPDQNVNWWRPIWQRCRDADAGQDAVKRRGMRYLPSPPAMQDDAVYRFYLDSATFFGATGRTLRGLTGTLFRRPPIIPVLHPRFTERMANFDHQGTDIFRFSQQVGREQILIGHHGVLVGKADGGPEQIPYATSWAAEQILGIQDDVGPDGQRRIRQVRLHDALPQVDPQDEFQVVYRGRVQVYDLDADGLLVKRVFLELPREQRTVDHYLEEESLREFPTRNGERLDFVPFYLFQAGDHPSSEIQTPPMLDLVNENMAHYRASASYERARHRLSDPTLAIFDDATKRDVDKGNTQAIRLGGDKAIVLGSAGKMEIAGTDPQSLIALRDPLNMRRENMALLGSRLLETPRKLVEATETHMLRASGENATLVDIANAHEKGMTRVLQWVLWWAGESPEFVAEQQFVMEKDFVPVGLDPNVLRELVSAWQNGAISHETLLFNMKKGEALRPDKTVEQELDAVRETASPPSGPNRSITEEGGVTDGD